MAVATTSSRGTCGCSRHQTASPVRPERSSSTAISNPSASSPPAMFGAPGSCASIRTSAARPRALTSASVACASTSPDVSRNSICHANGLAST